MDVRLPDGTIIKNVPEGVTQADLMSRVQKMSPELFAKIKSEGNANPAPPMFVPSGEKEIPSMTSPEGIAGNPVTRFALGAAAPIIGGAQLAANAVGAGGAINDRLAQLDAMKRKGMEQQGAGEFDVMGAAGQALSPAFLGAAKALPATESAAARIGQGAAFGGASGALEPVIDAPKNGYWGTKGIQFGGGLAAGAALPAAWEGTKAVGRGVRNVVQPYMGQWGADQAAGRLANIAVGGDRDRLISELNKSQPIIAGSNPTAGQIGAEQGSAELAGLQKLASERSPSQYFGPQGIEGQQNAARVAALRTVGGTPQDLESAINQRSADAATNYGAAYAQQINADPKLAVIAKNPYFKDALPDAMKLAEAEGINPKTDLTRFLHFVKISMDKQIGRVGDTALSNTERGAVQSVKSELTNWLAKNNPAYESARADFAAASKPINQMQVGQELENRLVPALSEDAKQRSAAYAQALRDAPGTIKRATGQPRFDDLNQIMRPDQMETLRKVKADLARDALYKELSSKGLPAARSAIGTALPEAPPTGMFSPILSVTRGAYNRATGKATDKIMTDLAQKMQNPQEMARIMQSAKPFERKALVDALMRLQAPASVGAANQIQGAQ